MNSVFYKLLKSSLIIGISLLFKPEVFSQNNVDLSEPIYDIYRVNVIHDKSMQQELGLSDGQVESLLISYREKMGQLNAELEAGRANYAPEDLGQFLDYRNKLREKVYADLVESDLESVLLPVQFERLNQLAFWTAIEKGGGIIRILRSDFAASKLGIDKDQAGKLSEELNKLDKEFKKKLSELKSEYHRKMIDVLEPSQQKELKKMLGDPLIKPKK